MLLAQEITHQHHRAITGHGGPGTCQKSHGRDEQIIDNQGNQCANNGNHCSGAVLVGQFIPNRKVVVDAQENF